MQSNAARELETKGRVEKVENSFVCWWEIGKGE